MGLEEIKKSINGGDEYVEVEVKKCCSDCKTTKTPLWRVGPAGPKSLCNACGIRYRKKRRDILSSEKKKKEKDTSGSDDKGGSCGSEKEGLREDLKIRLKMVFQRSAIVKKQRCQRRKRLLHGEEEQAAAFCLMALSSGSVSVFA
ncbi:GATA transcription factor 15 [Euphorbia peplus]|nr:GATA transcription factor 15 [Euphorbia peplus]